ncbi:DUF6281 family protein [Nocardioides marmorisolisilvae]|uniref:DUF6281 family protein n=1 Tax=Nocardioides marmorisolisilvae TaxID=1542737 RepID=UPI001C839416
MRTRSGISPLVAFVVVSTFCLSACGETNSGSDGHREASCAQRVKFDSQVFVAQAAGLVKKGRAIGRAVSLGCSDGGRTAGPVMDAFVATGLDPNLGLLVDDPSAGLTLYVREESSPADAQTISDFISKVSN